MLELKVHDDGVEVVLQLEHSLLSLSKWEADHKRSWFVDPNKPLDEMLEYYEYMILNPGMDPRIIYRLEPAQLEQIQHYINDTRTATVVPKDPEQRRGAREVVTTELVYYWMTALKINWEAETWHFNRLMVLINLTNYHNQPEKKRSKGEVLRDWAKQNAMLREKFGTTG